MLPAPQAANDCDGQMGLWAAQSTPPHGIQHLMGVGKLLSQLSSSKLGLHTLSPQPTGKDVLQEKDELIEDKPTIPTMFMEWRTTSYNPGAGDKLQHLRRPLEVLLVL